MTFKELNAVVSLLGSIIAGIWLANDLMAAGGLEADVSAAAVKLLWVIGFLVIFNVVGMILAVILASILRGEEVKDEATDERDRLVSAKALGNGYLVTSIGMLGTLFAFAFGWEATPAVHILFGGALLAGAVEAGSRLVYYRIG